MNENNHARKPEPGLPPAYALPKIEVHVPEVQRQQLMHAVITLVSVLLGIALTLSSQVVSQVLLVEEPGLSDPIKALGVTHFSELDVTGAVNFGSNDLYPLGYTADGYQAVYGTAAITGTATASHGLSTVTFALCSLGEDPGVAAGDGAFCTASVASNVVTLKVWQDDLTAATEADVDVHWLVIGQP